MAGKHITLIVPALLDSLAGGNQSVPRMNALETLLAKADHSVSEEQSYYDLVLSQFDISQQSGGCIAAISRYAESSLQDERIWMQLTPVYLHADRDRLILQGNRILDLADSEVQGLLAELNSLYKEDGFEFEAYNPNRWYLAMKQKPLSRFAHYDEVLGRSVESFMPQGDDQTSWRRFINEVQMILHASEVNQLRNERNLYPLNSVWCWGVGTMPEKVSAHWHCTYSHDPLVKGLASLADVSQHDLPEHADMLIKDTSEQDAQEDHHDLVVFEQTDELVLSVDFNTYVDRLKTLEEKWFAPLLAGLRSGHVASVRLLPCNCSQYTLQKGHLRRFWRRKKAIQ